MKRLYAPRKSPMRVAAFMSGTGSNLRKILEKQKKMENDGGSPFEVVMIFSDRQDSNAGQIAAENGISHYCSDRKEYYGKRGADAGKDAKIREEYDVETVKFLEKHEIDVVALCGYMGIVSREICDRYVTVNVHPADLRIPDANGKRALAGCIGAECIKKAISRGEKEARSSTHLVTAEVDGGAVLMVSDPVKLEIDENANVDEFAKKHQEILKEKGDWKIYPETIKRIALGRFWIDEKENLAIDVVEEKELLRSTMKEFRNKIGDHEVRDKSRAITGSLARLEEYANAGTVMFYMASAKEVQTRDAIKAALEAGKTVLLPITDMAAGKIDPVRLESPEKLREGPFGVMEPEGGKAFEPAEIDLVIVPGLSFDAAGNRIGYGLGFYDRFLCSVPAVKVALSYESQIVDRILTEPHDVAVDRIVTETRVMKCGGQTGAESTDENGAENPDVSVRKFMGVKT